MRTIVSKAGKRFVSLLGILLFIGLWQGVVALHVWDTTLLPSPRQTWDAIRELAKDGILFPYVGISLYRFVLGYGLALLLAVPLGLLLGWFVKIQRIVNPVLQLLRPISPTAWFPFIVLWFGIGDAPAIAIITIAAFFPVLFSTIAAIARIDPLYLRVSDNLGFSRFQFFYKIAIPSAFPYMMIGLHIAIGTAWIFLVAGEMVGAQEGLGYLIVDARNNMRTDMVLAGIFLIGVTGWALDSLVRQFERFVAWKWGWQQRSE
ncbi:MAG: ABC transporter permease [Paraprevotella sp.]|nr:ABC transporter permease [Paraprevotella sp.]